MNFIWFVRWDCVYVFVVIIWLLFGIDIVWLKFVIGKFIWFWCSIFVSFFLVDIDVDEYGVNIFWKDGFVCFVWEVIFVLFGMLFWIVGYGSKFCSSLVWVLWIVLELRRIKLFIFVFECWEIVLGVGFGWLVGIVEFFLWFCGERFLIVVFM